MTNLLADLLGAANTGPFIAVLIAFLVAALIGILIEIIPAGSAELKRAAQIIILILILFIIYCVRLIII